MRISPFAPPAVTEASMTALTEVVARAVAKLEAKHAGNLPTGLRFFSPVVVTLKPGNPALRSLMPVDAAERGVLNALMTALPVQMAADQAGTAEAFRAAIEATTPKGMGIFDFRVDTTKKGHVQIRVARASSDVLSAFASETEQLITSAVANAASRGKAADGPVCNATFEQLVDPADVETLRAIMAYIGKHGIMTTDFTPAEIKQITSGATLAMNDPAPLVFSRFLGAIVFSNWRESWNTFSGVPHDKVVHLRQRLLATYPEAVTARDRASTHSYATAAVFAPVLAMLPEADRDSAMEVIVARLRSDVDGQDFAKSIGVPRELVEALIAGEQIVTPIPVATIVVRLLDAPDIKDDSWWTYTSLDHFAARRLRTQLQKQLDVGSEKNVMPPAPPTTSFKADALLAKVAPSDRRLLNECLNAAHDAWFTPGASFMTMFQVEREAFRACLAGGKLESALTARELVGAILSYVSRAAVIEQHWTRIMTHSRKDVRDLLERYRARHG